MIQFFKKEKKKPLKLQKLSEVSGIDDGEVAMLLVHHDQCIHCKNFKPMWTKLCEKYQKTITGSKTVTLYDISNRDNEPLWSSVSDRFGIDGYPTVLIFKKGADRVDHHEYTGPREEFAVWSNYIDRQCV